MHLYILETSLTKDDYYVVASDMKEAGEKLIEHLKPAYNGVIITNCKWVCNAPPTGTTPSCTYQYKLVL